MGLKLQGVFRCGACGKPHGFGTHVCSPGRRRKRRTTLQNPVAWQCRTCGQPRGLRHACRQRSDFRARKRKAKTEERRRRRKAVRDRQAARRRQAATDRRARDRARRKAAKRRPKQSRPRGESHEPGSCGDRECQKYGCKAYWAGMDNCLRPHEGE